MRLRRRNLRVLAIAGLLLTPPALAAEGTFGNTATVGSEAVVPESIVGVPSGSPLNQRVVEARKAFDQAKIVGPEQQAPLFRAEHDRQTVGALSFTGGAVTLVTGGELAELSIADVEAAAAVAECDRLAANPADPNRRGEGVWSTAMDTDAAVAACAKAVAAIPDEPRLAFQYGRALTNADRWEESIPLLTKAAEKGYLIAKTQLAICYIIENGVASDGIRGLGLLKEAADAGDGTASYFLGRVYSTGKFVGQDQDKAIALFRKSADTGNAYGMYYLALVYVNGSGVTKDVKTAYSWFHKAADLGYPAAQRQVAEMLHDGTGTPADVPEAVRYMRMAAEGGDDSAQYSMGTYLAAGDGIAKDLAAANEWYAKAAASDHRGAHFTLAVNLALGRGTEKDPARAAQHMIAAIRLGDTSVLAYLMKSAPELGKPFVSALQTELAIGQEEPYQGAITGTFDAVTRAALEAELPRGSR